MEADSREYNEKTKKPSINMEHDGSPIFQSAWVRRNSVLVDPDDWKSLARQFRYVFYCGVVLWAIHIISVAIKA